MVRYPLMLSLAFLGIGLVSPRAIAKKPATVTAEQEVSLKQGEKTVIGPITKLSRVAVGNPDVADVTTIGDEKIQVVGKTEGKTTVRVWTLDGTKKSYSVTVAGR